MADTLVQRLTGQGTAEEVPVEINLIMTTDTLLNPTSPESSEPAHLDGYGPLPAPIARDLALTGTPARWIRRLLTHPDTGQLVALESRRRTFTPAQRRFLQLHDQSCRTPYCDAPLRHADHIQPAETGGVTHVHNGRGTCEACNYTNQSPGWHSHVDTIPGNRREIDITTPTGHRYRSRPPDLPGTHRLAS